MLAPQALAGIRGNYRTELGFSPAARRRVFEERRGTGHRSAVAGELARALADVGQQAGAGTPLACRAPPPATRWRIVRARRTGRRRTTRSASSVASRVLRAASRGLGGSDALGQRSATRRPRTTRHVLRSSGMTCASVMVCPLCGPTAGAGWRLASAGWPAVFALRARHPRGRTAFGTPRLITAARAGAAPRHRFRP